MEMLGRDLKNEKKKNLGVKEDSCKVIIFIVLAAIKLKK